jgi:hypothetical protein
MDTPRVVAVIPALDEEESIGGVVREMPSLVSETIVVDNGSRDGTVAVARAAGARVVKEPRRGYGQACLAGIAAAGEADVILFLDGDGSDDPAQAAEVVAPLLEGRADLVIGSRTRGRRVHGAQPWHAIVGTRACVWMMNRLTGARASDLGPFRAITGGALRRLGMADRDYGWTVEMQVKAALGGLRVLEVPVDHRPRAGGRSKVSGTVRGTVGAGTKIVGTILRHAWRLPALALAGLALSAVVLAWAMGPPPTSAIARHLGLYGAAFAAYLVALVASRGLSGRGLLAALVLALVWRAVLIPVPPLLSDDVNRYVWEGRVQLHGGNPYRWDDRPDAPRWIGLRDSVWDGVNHKEYTAVYPPLFILATRGVVALHDSITAMKAFLVLCEVATGAVLLAILRRRRHPLERLLVLAWSPLALVEIAGSGHNEAFSMLWLVLALSALEADRPFLSALAVGAGFMSKFLPGLVAAGWARRYRVWHVATAAVISLSLVVPFLSGRRTLLLSLSKYSRFWTFNETLFAPLAALLGHGGAVRAGALLAAALALALAWRRTEPVAAATAVVAASLLLSPNVLPWYALWLVPLLVLRDEPPALLFTGTVALAYLVYPRWQSGERWWLAWHWRALEYLPVLLVAVWTWRSRTTRSRPAPVAPRA